MFSKLSDMNFNLLVIFISSSAKALNSDKSEIYSLDKQLSHIQIVVCRDFQFEQDKTFYLKIQTFNDLEKEAF